MTRIQTLKQEAKAAMVARGHTVTRFKRMRSIWDLDCHVCHRGASVMLEIPPNGIEVFGSGLALQCDPA